MLTVRKLEFPSKSWPITFNPKFAETLFGVVLQKITEDRKLLQEGSSYATNPKILAMNLTRSLRGGISEAVICRHLIPEKQA